MRTTLVILALLAVSSCYPLRNARFIDESQSSAKAWICSPDDEPTNPAGIKCVDIRRLLVPAPRPTAARGPVTDQM